MDDITNAQHIRRSQGGSGLGWIIGGAALVLVLLYILLASSGTGPEGTATGAITPAATEDAATTGATESTGTTTQTAPAATGD